MRFDMQEIPPEALAGPVQIGNVYAAKGGRGTVVWLVVSIRGNSAYALGLNQEGEIASTTHYGVHVFESREVIGRCPDIAALSALKIEWVHGARGWGFGI